MPGTLCFCSHVLETICNKRYRVIKISEKLLRYYATFKVRKCESLLSKINTFLQKTTTCTGLQAGQIFSVSIWYTYFFNFGRGFCGPFLCYFQKLQLLLVKIFWNNFCCIVSTSTCMSSKIVFQIFKI